MSRYRLHVAKINEFEDYCFSEGWKSEMPKSFYEALRMKKDKKTLLVHKRIESSNGGELVHLTLHGESEIMFSKYIRSKKK